MEEKIIMPILINKTYKIYDKISRYSQFPYYTDSRTGGIVNSITAWLDDTTPYINHIVERGDTLDSLALKYYSSPLYYWIICSFNRLNDPFQALDIGSVIKIPTFSSIQFKD